MPPGGIEVGTDIRLTCQVVISNMTDWPPPIRLNSVPPSALQQKSVIKLGGHFALTVKPELVTGRAEVILSSHLVPSCKPC